KVRAAKESIVLVGEATVELNGFDVATGFIGLASGNGEAVLAIRQANATRGLANVADDADRGPFQLRGDFARHPTQSGLVRDQATKRLPRHPINIQSFESKSIVLHRATSFTNPEEVARCRT